MSPTQSIQTISIDLSDKLIYSSRKDRKGKKSLDRYVGRIGHDTLVVVEQLRSLELEL